MKQRHRLTEEAMLKGTTNAIASLRKKGKGPTWLIPVLEKRRDALLEKLGRGEKSNGSSVAGRFRRLTRLGREPRGASRTVVVALLALSLAIGAASALLVSPRRQVAAQTFAIQQGFFNAVFSANGTLLKTITPSANGSVRLYSVGAYCGTPGTGGQLVVQVMPLTATGLWNTGPFDIGANLSSYYFVTPLQGPPGVPVVIQVANCNSGGATNITLEYQYSVD